MVVTSFDHQCEGTGAVSPLLLPPPSGIVHDCGLGLDSHGFVFSFSASPHEFELPVVVRTVCWHVTLLKSKCNNDIFYKFLFHFLQSFSSIFFPLLMRLCAKSLTQYRIEGQCLVPGRIVSCHLPTRGLAAWFVPHHEGQGTEHPDTTLVRCVVGVLSSRDPLRQSSGALKEDDVGEYPHHGVIEPCPRGHGSPEVNRAPEPQFEKEGRVTTDAPEFRGHEAPGDLELAEFSVRPFARARLCQILLDIVLLDIVSGG